MRGPLKKWTRRELDAVEEMRLLGMSNVQIARELGRSVRSINGVVFREGMPKTCEREMLWLEEFRRGGTDRELARRMGVLHKSVKHIRRRLRQRGVLPKHGAGEREWEWEE